MIGVLLVLLGFVGFLPIIGFWMIPLGIIILSVDVPPVRRVRRRFVIWWQRRKRPKGEENGKK
jgi:purine-cytosine permease-like protein